MGNCKTHGYYDDNYNYVGMGCPKCYENDEIASMNESMNNANTCSKCKEKLKQIETDCNGVPIVERFTMIYETGYDCGNSDDWEKQEDEFHLCRNCREKLKEWLANK